MNAQRMRALEQGQTNIARKVLSCVPIQEAWTEQQIVREVARSVSAPDVHIIAGCINSLRESGLIKEPTRGRFQRVAVKDEPESEPAVLRTVPTAPAPKVVPIVEADPLQRFAELSANLRRMADDIDESALTMAAAIEQARVSGEKFRQLQALLKSTID